MKKKALVVIVLYFSLMFIHLINFNSTTEENVDDIQVIFQDGIFEQNIDVINRISKTKGTNPINQVLQPLDLVTPSYTNLSLSEGEPIVEGTEITLSSLTTSSGHGVSSGEVDFIDLKLLPIDVNVCSTPLATFSQLIPPSELRNNVIDDPGAVPIPQVDTFNVAFVISPSGE